MGDRRLELSQRQREICLHLLNRVRELAEDSGPRLFNRDADPVAERNGWGSPTDRTAHLDAARHEGTDRKPQGGTYNTFAINGGRGTGKSTLLHVFSQIVPHLGLPRYPETQPSPPVAFSYLVEDKPELWKPFASSHGSGPADNQRSALVLPIIDPSLFEDDGRTVMEQVLAHLQHRMTLELQSSGGRFDYDAASTWQEVAPRRDQLVPRYTDQRVAFEERLKNLQRRLIKDIAPGWLYAQSIGQTMLVNDSASFDEYSQHRARLSVISALRHIRWQEFVNDLLATFNTRLLVICFDDSDLNPSCTLDVLDAIRIYLKSELIMVVLATELATLEHNLTLKQLGNLQRLGPAYAHARPGDMRNRNDEVSLDKLRDSQVRHEIQEATRFIEKIVPQPQRFQLDRIPNPSDTDHCERFLRRVPPGQPSRVCFAAPDEWLLDRFNGDLLATLAMRDLKHLSEAREKSSETQDWRLLETVAQLTSLQQKRDTLLDLYGHPGELIVRITRKSWGSHEIWVEQADEGGPRADAERIGGIIRQVPSESALSSTMTSKNVELHRYGRFAEYLVDRRRLDPQLAAQKITVQVVDSDELRPLPPVLIEDVRAIQGDQDGDVKQLVERCRRITDWPRNVRFLSDAYRIVSKGLLPAQAFDPTEIVTVANRALSFPGAIGRLLNMPLPESILSVIAKRKSTAPSSLPVDDFALLSVCVGVVSASEPAEVKLNREAFMDELRTRPQSSLEASLNNARVGRTMINLIEASSRITRSFQLMLGALRCAEARLAIFLPAIAERSKWSEAITPEMLLGTSDDSLKELIGKFETCVTGLREAVKGQSHLDVMEMIIDLLLAMVGPIAELRVHAGAHQGRRIARALMSLVPRDPMIHSLGGFELSTEDTVSLGRLLSRLRKLFKSYETDNADRVPGNASLTLQSILRMPASAIEVALERQ